MRQEAERSPPAGQRASRVAPGSRVELPASLMQDVLGTMDNPGVGPVCGRAGQAGHERPHFRCTWKCKGDGSGCCHSHCQDNMCVLAHGTCAHVSTGGMHKDTLMHGYRHGYGHGQVKRVPGKCGSINTGGHRGREPMSTHRRVLPTALWV